MKFSFAELRLQNRVTVKCSICMLYHTNTTFLQISAQRKHRKQITIPAHVYLSAFYGGQNGGLDKFYFLI